MFKLITILGPTATGKTRLAARLASIIGGEVISADSRQVYRGMDLGTGKDIADFRVEEMQVPYHLIDIEDPGAEYNVFAFQHDFSNAIMDVSKRANIPIMCGGSGLYLDAILRNYKLDKVPENKLLRDVLVQLSDDDLIERLKSYGSIHNTTDTLIRSRMIRAIEIKDFEKNYSGVQQVLPKIKSVNFGIRFPREIIRERITERLEKRLEEGMIDEVIGLLDGGLLPEQLTFYGLEYKFLTQHITGELSFDEMFTLLNTAIHQFAKRQMTWFRRMENKGVKINWIDGNITEEEKLGVILRLLPK